MAVTVSCPQCHASFPVSAELLGKKMRCRGCQTVFIGQATAVKVGAATSASRTAPGGASNGAHVEPQRVKNELTAKSGDKTAMFAFFGIGTAVALMSAVTVWALFLKDSNKDADIQPVAGGNVSKINITDAPRLDSTAKPDSDKANEQPKSAKPADAPKITVAKFDEAPKNLPYRMEPATEARIKKSACWIKMGFAEGGGAFGSGWVAEPGIIITNSHVVGMKEPSAAPPAWLKIIFNAGMQNEREFEGKLLGLDRDNDLAVIRIEGADLPEPMPLARSSELVEGQHVYVCGFPQGSTIAHIFSDGKNNLVTTLKLRQSTVAGRMPTKTGSIKYVQIEGGADHGNSGGAVVDTAGYVRTVLVAGIPGSTLRFTIPCEYALYLLEGRMLKVVPSQAYEVDGKVRQQLTAYVADPMKRIKAVALDIWAGDAGRKIRPSSSEQPGSQPGDGPHQTVEMAYDPNAKVAVGESRLAKAEWAMTEAGENQTYWIQPRYTGIDGKVRWGEAVAVDLNSQPVQRKPAMLTIKHKAGAERKVNIESHIGITAAPEGGELQLQDSGFVYSLTEKTNSVAPDGMAKMQFTYGDIRSTSEDMDYMLRNMMKGVLEAARGMTTEMQVSKRGIIRSPKPVMKNVPIAIRPILERYNIQTVQSLEALALALPDREVQPGETWQHDQNYTVVFGRQLSENALFKMTYRYVGTRIRDGREEAVIEFDGAIVRGEGSEVADVPAEVETKGGKDGSGKAAPPRIRGMHGASRGAALVDLATGLTTRARTTGDVEFEVSYILQTLKFGAGLRIDMQREIVPGTATKSASTILPNQELTLNPFVGSPDHKLTLSPTTSDDRKATTKP
jgi:S1-C subfamily serine protease